MLATGRNCQSLFSLAALTALLGSPVAQALKRSRCHGDRFDNRWSLTCALALCPTTITNSMSSWNRKHIVKEHSVGLLIHPLQMNLILTKIDRSGLCVRGLNILPNVGRRHRHFPDMILHFPQLPLPLANYSSSEVLRMILQVTIYICPRPKISPQL